MRPGIERATGAARRGADEAYATLLYGSDVSSLTKYACVAFVLGQALKALDPVRPRVLVVDRTVPKWVHGIVLQNNTWTLFEIDEILHMSFRKSQLFLLPYRRVFFIDADILPIQGFGESAEARQSRLRRLSALWHFRQPLAALLEGMMGELDEDDVGCFNSGIMAFYTNKSMVPVINEFATMQEEWVATRKSPKDTPPRGHPAWRCGTGHDQPPLNAAFKGLWAPFKDEEGMKPWDTDSSKSILVVPQRFAYGETARHYYQSHLFYHAWSGNYALNLGPSCGPTRWMTDECKFPLWWTTRGNNSSVPLLKEYLREWWGTFETTASPWQKDVCLRPVM